MTRFGIVFLRVTKTAGIFILDFLTLARRFALYIIFI
jgi:hypothetical protein